VWEAKRECVVAVHIRNIYIYIYLFIYFSNKGILRLLPAYTLCVIKVYSLLEDSRPLPILL